MLRERGGENIDLRQSPAEAGEEAAGGKQSRVSRGRAFRFCPQRLLGSWRRDASGRSNVRPWS